MNKSIKKRLSLLSLTAVLSLLVSLSASAGESLDRIMSNKLLKVATAASWAPQSFINDDNVMDGFDVNVAQEIAKRLGVEIEFVTPEWAVITAGSWNGRWDMSVGSMTPTSDRAKVLSFPAVYYYTPAVLVVHNDSKAQSAADLNDKKLGACASCTFELYLQHDLTIDAEGAPAFTYDITPASILSLPNAAAVMNDLRLGDGVRVDGLVDALPAVNGAIEAGYPFRVVGEPLFYEPLAIALEKGDAELDAKIAAIVDEMKADGALTALSTKWYGEDYTTAK